MEEARWDHRIAVQQLNAERAAFGRLQVAQTEAAGFNTVEVVAPDGRFRTSANRPSTPNRIGDAP